MIYFAFLHRLARFAGRETTMIACCFVTAAIVAATCTAWGPKSPRCQRETGFVLPALPRFRAHPYESSQKKQPGCLWISASFVAHQPDLLMSHRMKLLHHAHAKRGPGWRREDMKTTALKMRWQHDAVGECQHGTRRPRPPLHPLVPLEKEVPLNVVAWQPATSLTSPSASESCLRCCVDMLDECINLEQEFKSTWWHILFIVLPTRIILMEMESHAEAWPFLEPVNPRLVPGYRRIIKNPMDFLTMRERLLQGG